MLLYHGEQSKKKEMLPDGSGSHPKMAGGVVVIRVRVVSTAILCFTMRISRLQWRN